jgi:hypothetical protein
MGLLSRFLAGGQDPLTQFADNNRHSRKPQNANASVTDTFKSIDYGSDTKAKRLFDVASNPLPYSAPLNDATPGGGPAGDTIPGDDTLA